MAFTTLEIVSSHVDVTGSLRMHELARQIGMFDSLSPATIEVAGAAGSAARMADVFGHQFEVDFRIGHAGRRRCFFIGSGGVVTHQTIDFGHVGKIKGVVFPTVSRMT
jgi:hypothetical protein